MAALETTGLTKLYEDVAVVDGIDLIVPERSVFGFLGPNGAGKTTTMKMLLGLIRPNSGSAQIFGRDIETHGPEVRRRIGYLPQQPSFYPHMTARETLRFAANFFFSGPSTRIEARVEEMLELVGIADDADRAVKTFSGGELQRLGIAQAQIHQPDVLILDEPAAALDPLGRRDVLAILEQFRTTSTVFYSTHILDDVQRVSDVVCILNKGKIVSQGPIAEILTAGGDSKFTVQIKGNIEGASATLERQPWVDTVDIQREGDFARLRIIVSDAEMAEAKMQRLLLADDNLIVKEFKRHSATLEDIFVDLVSREGGE